jgi:hypothetical protein
MIHKFKASFSGQTIAVTGLILLGVMLRLRQYLTGRSLWSDEAMLALNIVNRNFIGFFKPLDWDQGSPIGFLLLEKIFSLPFGRSEYALRFFPLVSGIASIWLFYLLLKRTTGGAGLFAALALFVLNPRLIYYSSEVKQYVVDVFVTLGLLLLASHLFNEKPQRRDFAWMALAGFLALWFSHPVLFVLAGIGVSLVSLYLRRRDLSSLRYSVGMGILWIANIILLYFLVLRDLGHNAYMYEYWQGAFMPLSLWKAMSWFWGAMDGIIATQFGIPYFPFLVFALFLIGWVILWLRNRNYAIVFALIFLVTLTASALRLYPFAERMILFLIPIGLLLLGKTVEALYQSLQKQRVVSILAALILSGYLIYGPLTTSAGYFLQPKYYEHIRPFMQFLHETWRPGDSMYISNGAVAQFEYYAPVYALEDVSFLSNGRAVYKNPSYILGHLDTLKGKSRVWILMSHVYEKGDFNERDFILNYLNDIGQKKREFRVPGTSVYLYLFDLGK